MSRVDILLSTFNGEEYLPQQLGSLEGQHFSDWTLVARDDGSTDSTRVILEDFARRHPDRVRLIMDPEGHLGAADGFSRLMALAEAEYVMFCDQDDVWLPNKIEKTLLCMKGLEERKGPSAPLMVHGDLIVVSADLTRRHGSFWAQRGIAPENSGRFNRQLVSNTVTGSTMMINRSLLEKAAPLPPQAVVHDWWIAQVASAFGVVGWEEEPMVLYRQHGENAIGARRYTAPRFFGRMTQGLFRKKARELENASVLLQVQQGRAFFERYKTELTVKQIKILKNYLRLNSLLPFFRIFIMVRYGLWRPGFLRNIAMAMAPRP